MKSIYSLIAVLTLLLTFLCPDMMKADTTTGTKIVGGDLSLVPAYVTAGDSWLKADGTSITTTADMLAYVKGLGWNSVRVRLFVDPSQDSDAATCQNLTYVTSLGAAIKSAGLNFLLDIHYSDTWADPSNQKIPASWTDNTNLGLADKVYSYTKEVLNTLTAASATPDFVQIGNEINGGMLWTTTDGTIKNGGSSNISTSDYDTYWIATNWEDRTNHTATWERQCRMLHAGSKAVRELCPDAKIIIHNAMEGNTPANGCWSDDYLPKFYTYITQSTDYPVYYDIIGLSYYPAWHGTLDYLGQTISALQTSLPTKEIQIVETGWYYQWYPSSAAFSSTTTPSVSWDVSALGQYNFLKDLTSTLNNSSYSHVTGLYYWQPEECGSGSDSNPVISSNWDNRGLWVNGSNGSHALQSASLATGTTDVSSSFTNLDFENGTSSVTGWSFNYNLGWRELWASALGGGESSLVSGSYRSKAYASSNVTAGTFMSQTVSVENGTYTVTAAVHADASGIYLIANDDKTEVTSSSTWGTAYTVSVTTTVTNGSLTIGLYSDAQTTTGLNVYSDNFKVVKGTATTVYPINALTDFSGTYTDDFTKKQTIADETYVGTGDYLTGFFGAFSPTYTLASGQTYNLKFVNHNAGTDNIWNNWVLYAVNGTGHFTTDRSDYKEYFGLRNDNWVLVKNASAGGLTKGGSSYSITGDESNFITDMNGATVDMSITYTKGTSIAVSATITATDGDVYTYTYTDDAAADVTEDNVYLFLTVDHSYIDMKSATSSGDITTTIDGITYTINTDSKTASATGNTITSGNLIDIVIPATITYNGESYTVTSIGASAFADNAYVRTLHVSKELTTIGASAFSGCSNLRYICLATGVTSIGENAFACDDDPNLEVVVLNCPSLNTSGFTTTSPFPASKVPSVRLYLNSTLYESKSTFTDIGFCGETDEENNKKNNICKVDTKDGVIYGLWDTNKAFAVGYTEDLPAQLLIPSTLHYDADKYIPCTQYFMDQIEQMAFSSATVLTNVTVCNNTNQIGMCAFGNCTNLKTITFGEDMSTFYDDVFYDDGNLTSVTLYNSSKPTQWGSEGYTPLHTSLTNATDVVSTVTLNCPYADASTDYLGFGAYHALTSGVNGDTTYDINELTYSDQSETDVTHSSLIQDVTSDGVTTYKAQYVTIGRALTADNYYTIVVPWDLSATEVTNLGITPYYFNGGSWYGTDDDSNVLYLSFDKSTTIQGGVPYLIKCTTSQSALNLGLEFTSNYEGLIEKKQKGYSENTVTFKGLYNKQNIPQGDFFVSGTKLYYTTDAKVPIGAFRGLLHIEAASSGSAKATQCAFSLDDGEISGVEKLTLDSETLQPIGSSVYDLAGRRLRSLPSKSGLYIVNGKKIIVK